MSSSEGQADNPQPQLSKAQRMEALDALTKQYKGSAKIPEADLTGIGYVRNIGEDGLVHFMFRERAEELARRAAEGEHLPGHKELPFERIPVTLSTAEQTFRYIPRTQVKVLKAKLKAVEWAFYPCWDGGRIVAQWESGTNRDADEPEDPVQVQNLRVFFLDYLNFTFQREQGKISKDALIELFAKPLPMRLSEDDDTNPNYFLHEDFVRKHLNYEDYSIVSTETRDMYNELTRLDGFFGDTRQLIRIFQDRLNAPIKTDRDEVHEEDIAYLHSIGIQTYDDFIRHTFPRYLEHIGLSDMATAIKTVPALSSVPETLKSMGTTDPSLAEEKELRKAIKLATPEERLELSKQLKDIDVAKKKRKQVRNGIIDYFGSPEVSAEVSRVRVKAAKEFLVAGKGNHGDNALFYLDATPNPQLDKDPGTVSGDCTAGKPLPFDRMDIPIHNVKIFDRAEKHIGNMYLLRTTEANDKESKVWHLDAIQIPISGIDWQTSVSAIVKSLAEAAQAKEVATITVNEGPESATEEFYNPLISNYDYIQEAVLRYWNASSKEKMYINIPQIDEENRQYSEFQGDGTALVLWKNPALALPT